MPFMWLIFLASFIMLSINSYYLYQATIYNNNIAAKKITGNSDPDAIFADAYYWGLNGNQQKSLDLYARVINSNNDAIKKNANFNVANVYLKQAYKMLDDRGLEVWDQVQPLLAMAKEGYRDALRVSPNWFEAKYNYELAIRLAPIIESKSSKNTRDEDDIEETDSRPPDGWPAIPGFPRGMP